MIKNILKKNVKIKRYKNFSIEYIKKNMCNKKYGIIYFLLNRITKEIFFIGCSRNKTLFTILSNIIFLSFHINSEMFNSRLCNYIRLLNLNDRHGYINIEIHELEYFEYIDNTEFLFKKR